MAIGILGNGCGLRQYIKPGKETNTVVEVEIVNMREPFLAQKLQHQIAQEIGSLRDLAGAIKGALPKKPVQAQLANQGDKQEDSAIVGSDLQVFSKVLYMSHFSGFLSGLEGFPTFGTGTPEEFGKALFLQEEIDRLQRDLFPLPEEGFLDLLDGVVSLAQGDNPFFEL
jgi:hypothetical protein